MSSSKVVNLNNSGSQKKKLGLIMLLYILGIFMGALDTGIVSPARTVIQSSLGVEAKNGIWMITIYTLAYAAVIPFSGKLADKLGRKYIYLVSVGLFGIGSSICGISSLFSSFPMLLVGRVIQALGGGGIMPIASAEFGTTFPKEKRGMALGLVGAAYGVANILGSSVGSAILNAFGNSNWKWLFFINLPMCFIIVIGGIFILPNTKVELVKKIDKLGTLFMVCIILSLLYGLKNIDFFNFIHSIKSNSVYPYLIIFAVLIPFFILIEKKAEDPILNLGYFSNSRILIVLLLGVISGIGMMGMIFVPQFAENALKIPTGTGGYFVAILGIFAGISAPISGTLIDKLGAKLVLLAGFLISLAGALFLAFVAIKYNNFATVCIGLVLTGLGVGFTIGTPLNYMMLDNTRAEDSNSALATLSLIRSVGTAVSPAIMVGFIAHAGLSVQGDLMKIMPQLSSPKITQLVELQSMMDRLKANPQAAAMLKNVNIPDFNSFTGKKVSMNGGTLPEDLIKKLQNADVTNISSVTKELAETMYNKNVPRVIANIQKGVQSGIDGIEKAIEGISQGEEKVKFAMKGFGGKNAQFSPAISQMEAEKSLLISTLNKLKELKVIIPEAFEKSKNDYFKQIDAKKPQLENTYQSTLNSGFKDMYLFVSLINLLAFAVLLLYKNKD